MSALDPRLHDESEAVDAQIDRLAEQAYQTVMDRLVLAVRDAVRAEVGAELADQKSQLREAARRVERIEQTRLTPTPAPEDLVRAAAEVAAAWTVLENAQFGTGEAAARRRLDRAVADLRTAHRAYSHNQGLMAAKGA